MTLESITPVTGCSCGAEHAAGERFYVSVVDAGRTGLLAGPFGNHAAALAHVEPARKLAERLDPFAHFYSFGTIGAPAGVELPLGKFNWALKIDAVPA